jgi:hypothetical protein
MGLQHLPSDCPGMQRRAHVLAPTRLALLRESPPLMGADWFSL